MSEHDVMWQVRESFSALRLDMPVEEVFARGRVRRRRKLSGLTAVAATAAGTAVAATLTLGSPASVPSGSAAQATPARLAAFSVTSGPGGSTTLILRRGPQFRMDPNALRRALAQHGIPALVTVDSFCRSTIATPPGFGQVLHPLTLPDGSDVMVINGRAMPPGTRLSIGYLPGAIRLALVARAARMMCSGPFHQPATRITPAPMPIRGQH